MQFCDTVEEFIPALHLFFGAVPVKLISMKLPNILSCFRARSPSLILMVLTPVAVSSAVEAQTDAVGQKAVAIDSRLELFADDLLMGQLKGCSLKLHEPRPANVALRFDAPWEGSFSGYVTVLQDGDRFRCYYRGNPTAGRDGSTTEVTCYAESRDGTAFNKPALGFFEVHGTRSNNVVLAGQAPFSHNFAPFLDTRPGVLPEERFKA